MEKKGKLEDQDFGKKSSLRVLREPRVVQKDSILSYTPGLGLFKKEDKYFVKRDEFNKLINYNETTAPFYLLSLAVEKFPRLTSLFDILYLDDGTLSWTTKSKKTGVRGAFEKETITVDYTDDSSHNLCNILIRNIKMNPHRYFSKHIDEKINNISSTIITWNPRTKADVSNLSGLNSEYIRDKLYDIEYNKNIINVILNKNSFNNLLLYNNNLSNLYGLKKENITTIEKILLDSYQSEVKGMLWVPVDAWRERLKSNGINEIYLIEKEILNSRVYRGKGYFFREKLLVETKEGAAGTNGLMGYAKHAYIKISSIELNHNGDN